MAGDEKTGNRNGGWGEHISQGRPFTIHYSLTTIH